MDATRLYHTLPLSGPLHGRFTRPFPVLDPRILSNKSHLHVSCGATSVSARLGLQIPNTCSAGKVHTTRRNSQQFMASPKANVRAFDLPRNLRVSRGRKPRFVPKAFQAEGSDGSGTEVPDTPAKTKLSLQSDRLDAGVRERVSSAIQNLNYRVTAGDTAAQAGVSVAQANEALQALAYDSLAALEVRNGAILDLKIIWRKLLKIVCFFVIGSLDVLGLGPDVQADALV